MRRNTNKEAGKVELIPQNKSLPIEGDKSLLLLLLRNKVEISHICGGFASCGTCRVYVESNINDLPPRDTLEEEMAVDRKFKESERLACQLCPFDGLIVRIPEKKKRSVNDSK